MLNVLQTIALYFLFGLLGATALTLAAALYILWGMIVYEWRLERQRNQWEKGR